MLKKKYPLKYDAFREVVVGLRSLKKTHNRGRINVRYMAKFLFYSLKIRPVFLVHNEVSTD